MNSKMQSAPPPLRLDAPGSSAARPRRRRRARPARSPARARRRAGRTRTSRRRARSRRRAGRATSGRIPCGSRKPTSLPSERSDDRVGALELRHRRGDRLLERPLVVGDQRGDHLGVGGRARAGCPSRASSSRSSAVFVRLPLWPSATVRAGPCCTIGWAFVHCVDAGRRVAACAPIAAWPRRPLELLLRRRPGRRAPCRAAPSAGRRRRPRSRPTPGRGAGARRGRSRRAARRPGSGAWMPKMPHIG